MHKSESELPWTGRHSPTRGRWYALAQAESYAAALDMLLAAVATSGDLIVLPSGRHPNDGDGGRSRDRSGGNAGVSGLGCRFHGEANSDE